MPELPDVELYVEALRERLLGRRLEALRLKSVFLLRSATPPPSVLIGRTLQGLRRVGKRIAFEFGPGPRPAEPTRPFVLLHLMIAGRLHWHAAPPTLTRRNDLAAFDFEGGSVALTEAGTKRRAALFVLADEEGLRAHERGGLEPLAMDPARFRERLLSARHTLKRALCDPSLFSGIGNAYSDEILHRARLSPLQRPENLTGEELGRLFTGVRDVLQEWLVRLRQESAGRFPEKVTAFRAGMAVHGRFGQPCPVCSAPIQRIVRAENEVNYCARCQTGGRLLKDRALSVLLKDDWPATLEELEAPRDPDGPSKA